MLLFVVFSGTHVAVALGLTAALGIFLMTDDIGVAHTFIANTAYEALRDYVFAVIPLFMLMAHFMVRGRVVEGLIAALPRDPTSAELILLALEASDDSALRQDLAESEGKAQAVLDAATESVFFLSLCL